MHFGGLSLHPSVPFLIWVATVVLIQFVGYPVLAIVALCVFVTKPVTLSVSLAYVWRARWLICVLWLVLALNTPGEAVWGMAWMPTYEGVADANIQSARLQLTLVCLAWLFSVLSGDRLLIGLYGVLMPLERLGVKVSGLIVRLSLVLENLQTSARPGSWRQMLLVPVMDSRSPADVSFTMPPWRLRDGAVLFSIALIIAGSVFW